MTDRRHEHLMPSIWQGIVGGGDIYHRIQLMGAENTPRTYCQKAPVTYITKVLGQSKQCMKCNWSA